MKDVKQWLMEIERPKLLLALCGIIHALTIRARSFYDEPDAVAGMRETNEEIHRVSGHMRALIDANEPLTPSRADGIAASAKLLTPAAMDRLYEFTT